MRDVVLFKRHEAAGIVAGFTFGAFFLVKICQLPFFPDNSIDRTRFFAGTAFYTLIFDNLPEQQLLAAV
jgi:hypothetical protein